MRDKAGDAGECYDVWGGAKAVDTVAIFFINNACE